MRVTRRSFLEALGVGAVVAAFPRRDGDAGDVPDCSFIQLSDTHIPHESGIERTAKVVEAINGFPLPHDLVIHTGDVCHDPGKIEDLKSARDMMRFTKEAHFVPGNRDITFDRPDEHEAAFVEVFGPCNRAISPAKGLRFVLFNSQPLSARAPEATRKKAFETLETLLTPPKPTVLFCHATGLPIFHENKLHEGYPEETMARWTDRMQKRGVMAVLAGHSHCDEHHVVGGIPFFLCAPVVGLGGRQSTFRHWELTGGHLGYRTVYVE